MENILDHAVPRLIDYEDDLLAIEMTIVRPPFLLDFSNTYIDQTPDFTDEVWAQWRSAKQEEFGSERFQRVEVLLADLHDRAGILLLDVHPGNVMFEQR